MRSGNDDLTIRTGIPFLSRPREIPKGYIRGVLANYSEVTSPIKRKQPPGRIAILDPAGKKVAVRRYRISGTRQTACNSKK